MAVVALLSLTTALPASAVPTTPTPTTAALTNAAPTTQSAAPARTQAAGSPDGIVVKDGVTQPVFPYATSITDSVFIETPVDSDADGSRDRVHVTVRRPAATANGVLKVAALVEPSPYWAGLLDVPNHGVDVDQLPHRRGSVGDLSGGRSLLAAPVSTKEYYVTRGYAYIEAESIGSGKSDGCPTSGDASETRAMRSVVEWLTGKARAWSDTGEPANARWSRGSVGMLGVSYNGTLPNQVATTGVPGLKTIVPIAAISSWYDYYRANGLVVAPGGYQGEDADVLARAVLTRKNPQACAAAMAQIEHAQDRITGDYSAFWKDRDYVAGARNVKASVFVTHGLNDWNVKTTHFAQWWDALGEAGVARKLWLHPGGHGRPQADAWRDTVHRWIDHYLYGVENGVEREPIATVERAGGAIRSHRNWPDPAARPVTLRLDSGLLGTRATKPTSESFVDSGATRKAEQLAAIPGRPDPNRLAYVTPPLARSVRLSGTPTVTLRASVDNRAAANLTALLVDYGPAGATAAPTIVSRGWMDVQSRDSDSVSRPVRPGKAYTFRWSQEPKDYVFAAGHRIGLLILSTDYDYTLRPRPGTALTVRPAQSNVVLPIVGGRLRF
jgi:X-Pro dipeptidyl-peptidase